MKIKIFYGVFVWVDFRKNKKKKEKMGRERKFWSVWFGVFVDGKLAGSREYFLAYQNVFSLNWGEN